MNCEGTRGEKTRIFCTPVRELWFPDVFIPRAKDVRVPAYKILPSYLRIYDSGLMMYSARVNYDLSCPMNFKGGKLLNRTIILNTFGQRSQYISIKFPLHKQSENP